MTNKDPEKTVLARFRHLFTGLVFAAGYKVSQRIYKFGGEPVVKKYMTTNYARCFEHTFGERNANTMMHATTGSIIGISEISLLPLDVLKIHAHTNSAAIAGKRVLHIVKTEGLALYRGDHWSAARNAPGSFALFGGAALAKEYIFQLENYNNAELFRVDFRRVCYYHRYVSSGWKDVPFVFADTFVITAYCSGPTAGCDQDADSVTTI
ncbi:hypothetical protein PsorP6_011421 [Peronosclerospora sorghi]|uniref:Uncharacterized protein n=1 Tax=Peronosclerospora sorghi TaxID=230839 RepID=A0ACC0WMZ7_9STRA|nr:hypothetical protein PsorP6_011421 [Peronosclerospora sorghi]